MEGIIYENGGFSMSMRMFALLSALCLSVSALAAPTPCNNKNVPPKPAGYILGMELTSMDEEEITFLTAGYVNNWLIGSLGANFKRNNSYENSVLGVLGHLGWRGNIVNNLYYTIGGMGKGFFESKFLNDWALGSFVGLDLHILPQFLLSGKIYPYVYEYLVGDIHQKVFSTGTIGLFYLF